MRVFRSAQLTALGVFLIGGVAAASPGDPDSTNARPASADSSGRGRGESDVPLSGSTSIAAARRAYELHQQAMAAAEGGQYKKAARLHKRGANLRAADDSNGIRCVELTGGLLYATGDLAGSRANFETVADRAMANGRIAKAADAYLKASLVAREMRDPATAMAYARQARRLADSPHLTAEERAGILSRIIE